MMFGNQINLLTMEYKDEEFYELTGNIQKDCHDFVNRMIDQLGKKGEIKEGANQDLINIFFYKKLADIELRLRSLERKTTVSYN